MNIMVLEVTVATIPPPYTSQPGQPQEVPMTAMPVTGKWALSLLSFTFKVLTLSRPVMPNGYTSERTAPCWSNPPFLIFLTFGHSGAQDWTPECPNVKKIKKDGLGQYGNRCFGRLILL